MDYTMLKPCPTCPFLRGTDMRLREERCEEIVGSNGEFPCHKTVDYSLETHDGEADVSQQINTAGQHCAGFLIFMEKNNSPTQMMRICERIRMYDAKKLMSNQVVVDTVFDDLNEMIDHHTQDD